MSQASYTVLRSGFDTLELAYRCAIPEKVLDALEEAKKLARDGHTEMPLEIGDHTILVEGSGGQGGYAYRLQQGGPFGAIWKFREKGSKDPWFAHVKLRAHGLATKGLITAKADCDAFLAEIGASFDPNDARVSRADFAVDIYAPGLSVDAHHILAHARSTKADLPERTMRGDCTNYLRIGKLPGKQLAIYDKSQAIQDKRDAIWQEIFKQRFLELGFPENTVSQFSDIWRIELRAGRNFLTSELKIRRWDKLLNSADMIFLKLANSYSWRTPISDGNRSRWPIHPIWPVFMASIDELDIGAVSPSIPQAILDTLRLDYLHGLERQHEGLLLTMAAGKGISEEALPRYLQQSGKSAARTICQHEGCAAQLEEKRQRIAAMFG